MFGFDPYYLSLSLEELYDRLHICEKNLVVETDILAAAKIENFREFIKNLIAPRLETVEVCQRKSALTYRLAHLADLIAKLRECLYDLEQNIILAINVIEKHKNEAQLQRTKKWHTEFEQERIKTAGHIEKLANGENLVLTTLLPPQIGNSGISPDENLVKIDDTVLKYEVRQYLAQKALDACEKQGKGYTVIELPEYLHFFLGEQPIEIGRLARKLREAQKAKAGPVRTISLAKLKDVFFYWLEECQNDFVKECIEIGIDPDIFETNSPVVKAEKLVSRCRESSVVLHKLLCYSVYENYSIHEFTVAANN